MTQKETVILWGLVNDKVVNFKKKILIQKSALKRLVDTVLRSDCRKSIFLKYLLLYNLQTSNVIYC